MPISRNAYQGYTNEFITSDTRKSTPERLFEQYCEGVDAIDWVYKNGDAGQQYFSIVYQDGFSLKQWLFYPDYIVKMKDGIVWIIETKGGMQAGHTKISISRYRTSLWRLRTTLNVTAYSVGLFVTLMMNSTLTTLFTPMTCLVKTGWHWRMY